MRVDYDGVSFAFDAALADSVSVVSYPAVGDDGFLPSPAYTEFILEGYGDGEYVRYAPQPRIDIFTIEDFGPYPFYMSQLDDLNRLLAERPDLNKYVLADTNSPDSVSLPFLPAFAAAQVFRAKPEYIEVGGVRGIRYLVYYSQAMNPIVEGEVFYTFQGITDDGQHYVSLILPVDTGLLPDADPGIDGTLVAENYADYLTTILQALTPASGQDFSPSLNTLDALAHSVDVRR
jgi:hypothetical protein